MGTSRNYYFDRSNYFYTQIVQKDIYEKISYDFLMRLTIQMEKLQFLKVQILRRKYISS